MKEYLVYARVDANYEFETDASVNDEDVKKFVEDRMEKVDFGDRLEDAEWELLAASNDNTEFHVYVKGTIKLWIDAYTENEAAFYANDVLEDADFGDLEDVEWDITYAEEY